MTPMPIRMEKELTDLLKEGARRIEGERWSDRSFIDRGMTWLFYSVVRRLLGWFGFADR